MYSNIPETMYKTHEKSNLRVQRDPSFQLHLMVMFWTIFVAAEQTPSAVEDQDIQRSQSLIILNCIYSLSFPIHQFLILVSIKKLIQ